MSTWLITISYAIPGINNNTGEHSWAENVLTGIYRAPGYYYSLILQYYNVQMKQMYAHNALILLESKYVTEL